MDKQLFQDKKLFRSEKGMVTIEATIALTSFLFVFVTIYSLTLICIAQAHIQVALNNTAEEISRYSYLYGLSGLDDSLKKFQEKGNETKSEINTFVGDSIKMYEGIQTLGDDAQKVDISDVDSMMDQWGKIQGDLKKEKDNFSSIKEDIEKWASNPQQLIFGMARLIGSEALELAKSRVIAEPITKVLIKKNLKRSEKDTAEAFCQSVGIVKGTYLGKESYFNGLDFSLSTLFPYGSEDITLVVVYKVKLIQLLPIDLEYSITQAAKTKGWLHGDKSVVTAKTPVETILNTEKNPGATIWNSMTESSRNKYLLESMEMDSLKKDGYLPLTGENYVSAYNEDTNTFVMVRSYNPVYEDGNAEHIDLDRLNEAISQYESDISSATETRKAVNVVETKGSKTTSRKVILPEGANNTKIILYVPDDPGVVDQVQAAIDAKGLSDIYEVKHTGGSGVKKPETPEESKDNEQQTETK